MKPREMAMVHPKINSFNEGDSVHISDSEVSAKNSNE